MKVTTLVGARPIVKTYTKLPDGTIKKESYPFVYEVSSLEHEVESIEDLFALISAAADSKNACLLKGALTRPLHSESRANSTDPNAPTQWICLDLDGVTGYDTVDSFLEDIGLGDTSYILQWSSSMGVEDYKGLRCHIFMLLDAPMNPATLKNWLYSLNLTTRILQIQLELTKTNMALRWPLDVTTCQNDKLLYVAVPTFVNLLDPYPGCRCTLRHLAQACVSTSKITTSTEARLQELIASNIEILRTKEGLPKLPRTSRLVYAGEVQYMANPEQATITAQKQERGFVYFNLNGGDSWGYYHPEDNPTYIYNFKGEPTYRTKDLLPEYWGQIEAERERRTAAILNGSASQEEIVLAFRDPRTSEYYNGFFRDGKLELNRAKNVTQLRDFLLNQNLTPPKFVSDWTREYLPLEPKIVDPDNRVVNLFKPSKYMGVSHDPAITSVPPTINKIIDHALGNNPEAYSRFLNWLACIIQFRTMTGTAWVLHGVHGTGKGLLIHSILTPLLGTTNVEARRMDQLDNQFTDFMENRLVVFIDEMDIDSNVGATARRITAKLKNLIAEPTISVRRMYNDAYSVPNYASFIFASNHSAGLLIEPGDRRFNVGIYQRDKLKITAAEIDVIEKELYDFYSFLMNYPADRSLARAALDNEVKRQMIDTGRTSIQEATDAIISGDMEFLWDQLPSSSKTIVNTATAAKLQAFRNLLIDIVQTKRTRLSRDEIHILVGYLVDNLPESPNKFTAQMRHYNIHFIPLWVKDRTVRGFEVPWVLTDEFLNKANNEIKEKLI